MSIIAHDSNKTARHLLVDSSGRIYVLLTDGTTTAEIDAAVKALVSISTPHHEIHEGVTFSVSSLFLNLADNANGDVHIIVGASKELHATITIAVEAQGEIFIYEGTTYDAAGTAVTPYDRNRTTGSTSNATAKHTPTVNTLGTKIFQGLIPGGTHPKSVGSSRIDGAEWILKKSTDYLIRVTNRGGADKDVSIEVDYYEV